MAVVWRHLSRPFESFYGILLRSFVPQMQPIGRQFVMNTRRLATGKDYNEIVAQNEEELERQWEIVENVFDEIAAHLDKGGEGNNRFSDQVTYVDFEFVSSLWTLKLTSSDDPQGWKRLEGRNGGRWAKLLEHVDLKILESIY